ncbi:MAG: valine--tRNA ligase [Parachlamydiaceae bacterium]|nr:valine--tRNA ligase [Parachlamydiaceae bacterium]
MQEKPLSENETLPKAYEAKVTDAKWYQFWNDQGFFKADPLSSKPAYCIVIPPPNVTGSLHMGHALVNTLQDVLIRWKRMLGFETAWIPGTDHAGIATQTTVERHLIKTLGKKRKDFSREEFLSHVWNWKEQNEHQILGQLKRLGCSCDWSRLRFTMDEGNNSAVRSTFKKLYDDGVIYRGDYLVNWDPVTQTALADDEVEYEERQSSMWHLKYPLQDGTGFIHIATTRPETMLGDTAIAVSPKDERYQHLIGKMVLLPLMNRSIPIIADYLVDPTFGTGMVKVTPAHDPNDYQMGMTHKLPFINIMTPDGKINENGGDFESLTMEEARKTVVKALQAAGFVDKIEPHTNRVGLSYRSKAVIEPYMSKQWFVHMESFGKKLSSAIREEKVKIIPENWENTYFHWIDNLRDWCISRQLWWGHRIPIWYSLENPEQMICYAGEGVPPEVAAAPDKWQQDEDVLDTWFSSALWPFATLGWPEKTPELKKFYPNAVLVTGHDILFFWVARMMMMGEYIMGEVPFPETFLHGLIYAKSYWRNVEGGGIAYVSEQERYDYEMGKPIPKDVENKWEKMSKTKGNIIDPIDIIEQYGTDAIRLALCASPSQAREIDLDLRRFEEFKNFANKIWNGARFVLMNLEGDPNSGTFPLTIEEFEKGIDEDLLLLEDRWLFSVLNRTIATVNSKLSTYLFDQATMEAYDFFWKLFCSYYVEMAKPYLFGKIGIPAQRLNKQKILVVVLLDAIRLMHPMAPFITEELFQLLKARFTGAIPAKNCDLYTKEAIEALSKEGCIVAPYPSIISQSDSNSAIEADFATIEEVVYTVRNLRGEMKIPPGTATDIHLIGNNNDPSFKLLSANSNILKALVKTNAIIMENNEISNIGLTSSAMVGGLKIMIPIPKELMEKEKTRLIKENEKIVISLQKMQTQLDNAEFVKNAPSQLIEKQRQQKLQLETELEEIKVKLEKMM